MSSDAFMKKKKAQTMVDNVNKHFQLLLLCSLVSLLSACSLFSQGNNNVQGKSTARIIPLLPVPTALQQKVWLERFTFTLNSPVSKVSNAEPDVNEGRSKEVSRYAEQSMLLQTELTNQGINIAAMSFDGVPLAQASWKSDSQVVNSELTVAKNFDAKQVLHDLQLVNWPISNIAAALANNFSVDEQVTADSGKKNKIRRFYHHGEVIIIISYQEKNIRFKQLTLGYQLSITRLNDSYLKSVN